LLGTIPLPLIHVLTLQIDEPFCCDIDQLVLENSETCLGFTFSGVPVEQMQDLCDRVRQVLAELADGKRELEMERMGIIIQKEIIDTFDSVRNHFSRMDFFRTMCCSSPAPSLILYYFLLV